MGSDDLRFRDRAVYLPASGTLVCADLHIGRARTSAVQSDLGERADLVERFRALVAHFAPAEVVVAGDVLHSFSTVPEGVAGTLDRLDAVCRGADASLVLVRGNHDTMLEEVWDGPVHDTYRPAATTLVCHGHEVPDERAARYVVGHDHPAIRIEGARHPCYLRGPARDGELLMLPAFTRVAAGTLVNRQRASGFQSPLVTDSDALAPIVRDEAGDTTHTFPPLGAFRRLLD